ELDLLPERAGLLDAVDQGVEIGGVALRVHPALLDDAGVAELLVLIDGGAHHPQVPAQLQLLLALHGELGDRHQRPGDDRQDGDRHDQLDEGPARPVPASLRAHDRSRVPPYGEPAVTFTIIPCLSNGSLWADGSRTDRSVKVSVVVPVCFLARNVRSI